MTKRRTKKEDSKTKGEALVQFVLRRYNYSKTNMAAKHAKWMEYYQDYRGTQSAGKEAWQANYVVTSLKEAIRTKTPLYMNILFSAGLKSFDVKPGEETDEDAIPILKDILIYQLGNVGRKQGGFFNQGEAFVKQFEMYGYSQSKQPWKEEEENGKTVFAQPDIEVLDIFNSFPDPGTLNIGESWIVLRKRDVFASYLRMLEKNGTYHSIKDLKDTSQPDATGMSSGEDQLKDDRVELLEYHGEVPKSLLEGKIYDEATVNPYEDDYVKAIITIANQEVCIRNEEYPYDCGNIFADASKDKMPNEKFGVGTAEDIQSYAAELTNAHNKFSDCVNIVANPMAIINTQKMAGMSGGIIITHPGKVFVTNPNVEDVNRAMAFINTTAQAAALTPLIGFINMLEDKIMKTTQAVPVISAMPSAKSLPDTLGQTRIQQGNAAEPIKHEVKHSLEPWFQRVLEIFYKHNIQFFSKESAYRILGKEKADRWLADKERKEIKKEDISLAGNPDFIPRGVSIFEEQQAIIANLLKFLEIAPTILKPQLDPMGNVQLDGEGKPVMAPAISMEEIAKRIGENMKFPELEDLIPGIREEREKKESKARTKATANKPAPPTAGPSPQGLAGRIPPIPAGSVRNQGGGRNMPMPNIPMGQGGRRG